MNSFILSQQLHWSCTVLGQQDWATHTTGTELCFPFSFPMLKLLIFWCRYQQHQWLLWVSKNLGSCSISLSTLGCRAWNSSLGLRLRQPDITTRPLYWGWGYSDERNDEGLDYSDCNLWPSKFIALLQVLSSGHVSTRTDYSFA